MMKFMFILMLLMAAMMAWWLIPAAFAIWGGLRYVNKLPETGPHTNEETIQL